MNSRPGNLVQNWSNRGKSGFLRGGQNSNCLKIYVVFILVLAIKVFCENLSENEAELLILEHIQYLRVLTRKLWFLANMQPQKGHKFWRQLPTTIRFCQNAPNIYMLQANKFHVWTNISKSRSGNSWSKIGEIAKHLNFFFVRGQNLKIVEI